MGKITALEGEHIDGCNCTSHRGKKPELGHLKGRENKICAT